MSTAVEAAEATARDPEPAGQRPRARRILAAVAGPALIVACVLFALRGFAFTPRLTNDHFDILSFWLPRFTFLARSLVAGHVPLWNPYEMMGYRFAADPQSGWLYVPAMLLFSLLSPGAAMRRADRPQPAAVAGLGLYWFLRKESLSRAAATAGGLALGMSMSTSEMAISMPFAGFLAWTTIVLVGASGYRQSLLWSRKLAWLALAAFAWWQVANAHMSHGLMMCTLLVAAYIVAHAIQSVRLGETSWPGALFVIPGHGRRQTSSPTWSGPSGSPSSPNTATSIPSAGPPSEQASSSPTGVGASRQPQTSEPPENVDHRAAPPPTSSASQS